MKSTAKLPVPAALPAPDISPETATLLQAFSALQRQAILDPAPVKQIVAGAGSGKTRTVIGLLEYCLRQGLEKAEEILVLSFSRKAVKELRERLPEIYQTQVQIQTFHGFCLQQIQNLYPEDNFQVIDPSIRQNFYLKRLKHNSEIGGIPISLLSENPKLFREFFPELAAKLARQFQTHKEKKNLLEFADLIDRFLLLLRDATAGNPQLEAIRQKYQFIVVDEFQDTDPRQFEFLCLMNSRKIVVVGDDWQAIYAFRGATVEPFLHFQQKLSAKIFYLSENYRSLPQIVNLGLQVIQESKKQIAKEVQVVRQIKTKFPNYALEMNEETNSQVLTMLKQLSSFTILVRSNQRRLYWQKKGIPEQQVMTIHRSKGLEFPLVFLDLCGGWGTISLQVDEKQQCFADEEIRVLYVGITRAENLLVFFYLPMYRPRSRDGFFWQHLISPHVQKVASPPEMQELTQDAQTATTLH